MSDDIGLLLDGLILVFLCVTIFYAARLSLFMKSLRQGRSETERLIRELNETMAKAEDSVVMMKENANSTIDVVGEVISEAKFLSDELKFMTETGDSLADRLEKLADRNRELVDLMESSGGIGPQKTMSYDSTAAAVPAPQQKKVLKLPHEQQEEKFGLGDFNTSDFDIDDFDLDSVEMDEDDEFDFHALGDGAYREEEAISEYDLTSEMDMDEEDDFEDHLSRVNTQARSKVRSFAIFDRDYDYEYDEDDLESEDVQASEEHIPIDEQSFHSRAEQDLYEALQRKKKAFDKSKPPSRKVNKIS